MSPFYLILFAGAIGTAPADMKPELSMGPFRDIKQCYAAGALGIAGLNEREPESDFRVSCGTSRVIEHRPWQHLLNLKELTERALATDPIAD